MHAVISYEQRLCGVSAISYLMLCSSFILQTKQINFFVGNVAPKFFFNLPNVNSMLYHTFIFLQNIEKDLYVYTTNKSYACSGNFLCCHL